MIHIVMTRKKSVTTIAKTTAPELVNYNTVSVMFSSMEEIKYNGINNVSSRI